MEEKRRKLPYIETHIVHHCNLNCRGCSHFSPLYEPWFKSIDDYEREMIRLSELFDIDIIRVMGGEPLLRDDFMNFLRITRKYFQKSKIVLVTNGLLSKKIVPHIDELNSDRISVHISNYHILKNIPQDIYRISDLEFHEKGELYNIGIDLGGNQFQQYSNSICDSTKHSWFYYQDGRLYKCCMMGNIKKFIEYFDLSLDLTEDDISVDIFNNDADSILEFLMSSCKGCRFCNIPYRFSTYKRFETSRKEIEEWTCQ